MARTFCLALSVASLVGLVIVLAVPGLALTPGSDPASPNVLYFGDACFTLLSPSLMRLQLLSRSGSQFDPRPSLSFPFALPPITPVPHQVAFHGENVIEISTDALQLVYNKSIVGAFLPNTLAITLLSSPFTTWRPGTSPTGNLNGTRLDLGCYDTFDACYSNGLGWGPLSRAGWALWDDTNSIRLLSDAGLLGYPWFDGPTTLAVDWYFFGHGLRFRDALTDFAAVSGAAPLPPAFAFGVWWSTWYSFSAAEFTSVVLESYARLGLPLDVVVLDMDWHTEPNAPNCSSWGGFSWNRNLFPDAEGYVRWLQSSANPLGHPLATLLNGHPDDGIGPCEDNYTAFAKIIGADPLKRAKFACNMSSEVWTSALFSTMLDPKGIDAWWTDYGGCAPPAPQTLPLMSSGGCPIAVQSDRSPQQLLWSNYVYDSAVNASGKRSLVLSRYGGIGNQRYGIGFSGDTQSTWSTLALQVAMTPTAANVLFGYWSHDLGGYNIYCPADDETITPCKCGKVVQPCNLTTGACGRAPAELYTRWLQFGVFSPIFRTHCSHCDRRIWAYPEADFMRMRDALLFRKALFPYLYTNARAAFDTAVSLVHPLYYDWPLAEEAYDFADTQYLFGEALLVAPVTDSSAHRPHGQDIWVPPGQWVLWNASAAVVQGPTVLSGLQFGLGEYPVFARAGAVIPTIPTTVSPAGDPHTLVWIVFSGVFGSGAVYEDDGVSNNYKQAGASSQTVLTHNTSASGITVSISAVAGTFPGAVTTRRQVLQIRRSTSSGTPAPAPSAVTCNGAKLAALPVPVDNPEAYSEPGWWIVTPLIARPWLAAGSLVVVPPVLSVAMVLDFAVSFAAVSTV